MPRDREKARTYSHEWYQRNKDRLSKAQKGRISEETSEEREARLAHCRARYQRNKKAHAEQGKAHYLKNREVILLKQKAAGRTPEGRKAKNASRLRTKLRKYGLTMLDYYAARSLGCEICRDGFSEGPAPKSNAMAMDHDHDSGRFRGFLCNACNFVLGAAKNNPGILKKAARYLETQPC